MGSQHSLILEWLGLGVSAFTQNAAEDISAENPGKTNKTKKNKHQKDSHPPTHFLQVRLPKLSRVCVPVKRHSYLTGPE